MIIWRSKGPPKDHLAAKGCPGFVVEFNICNIYCGERSDATFTILPTMVYYGAP